MSADELIAELATVSAAGANEWKELRASELQALSVDDNFRVYAAWRQIQKFNSKA